MPWGGCGVFPTLCTYSVHPRRAGRARLARCPLLVTAPSGSPFGVRTSTAIIGTVPRRGKLLTVRKPSGRVIGTDMPRLLVSRVSSDGQEREQDSEDNPTRIRAALWRENLSRLIE